MKEKTESLKTRAKTGEISAKELEEIRSDVKKAELLSTILDDAMLDPILGLVEGGGDVASGLAGLYIIYKAKKAGVPYHKLAAMMGRQAIDIGGGSIPIIGDLFDFVYKSNKKNAKVLREHFEKIEKRKTRTELEKLKKKV